MKVPSLSRRSLRMPVTRSSPAASWQAPPAALASGASFHSMPAVSSRSSASPPQQQWSSRVVSSTVGRIAVRHPSGFRCFRGNSTLSSSFRPKFNPLHTNPFVKLGTTPSVIQLLDKSRQKQLSPLASIESPPETKPEQDFDSDEEAVEEAADELADLQALTDVQPQGAAFPRKREYPCTADELHYVSSGDWRLAMWRYKPPPDAPQRTHPVLLLSGIATNALSYDIDPDVSLARHLRDQGFDVWTLEVRGMGLSHLAIEEDKTAQEKMAEVKSDQGRDDGHGEDAAENGGVRAQKDEKGTAEEGTTVEGSLGGGLTIKDSAENLEVHAHTGGLKVEVAEKGDQGSLNLVNTINQLRDQLAGMKEEGQRAALGERMVEIRDIAMGLLEEANQRTALSDRIADVAERLKGLVEEGQKTAVGVRVAEIQASLAKLVDEGQKVGQSRRVKDLTEQLSKVLDEGQFSALTEKISGVRESLVGLLGEGQRAALSGRISDLVTRLTGLLDEGPRTGVTSRMADLKKRLETLLEESQRGAPPRMEDVRSRMAATLSETQRTLEVIRKYDWDFDTLLHEDLPAAMAFLVDTCRPPDGKVLAVGHSMGGILLYSRLACLGTDAGLAAVVAVASSMNYSPSSSSLKLLLPLTTPARLTSVPVIPTAILARTGLPLITRPPYTLAWVGYNISARNMMEPDLFRKLLTHNFDTIPVRLLLQMASLFYPGGLKTRNGAVEYRRGLRDCQVPVLALAGAQDLVCPPLAVTETVKMFPEGTVTYQLFGESEERHYSHYDLLAGRYAKEEVYPTISDFLIQHDSGNGCS